MLVVPIYDWTRQPKIDWSLWNSVNVTKLKQLNLCSKSPWVLHEVQSNCLACCKSWNNWNNTSIANNATMAIPLLSRKLRLTTSCACHGQLDMFDLAWVLHKAVLLQEAEWEAPRIESRRSNLRNTHDTACPTSPCCSWSTTLTKYRCISGS